MSDTTEVAETPAESAPSAEPAAHKHEWVLRWQNPRAQRAVRDCADAPCGARLFTDASDQHLGTVKDQAPWVKPEHVAVFKAKQN
jgi:hypothetical protein